MDEAGLCWFGAGIVGGTPCCWLKNLVLMFSLRIN